MSGLRRPRALVDAGQVREREVSGRQPIASHLARAETSHPHQNG